MRITVPTIPHSILSAAAPAPSIPTFVAVKRIAEFLLPGNVTVLTGAGVSVDSGIRAYRGKDGRYMNPNYKPILYHELVDTTEKGHSFRQRYWLRSYLGYPPVRDAEPNPTHYALAALQYTNHVPRLITQNVDGLHLKATEGFWSRNETTPKILELHGTLHRVRCKNGHVVDRNTFQEWLSSSNHQWAEFAADLERTGRKPRTNPDGDVVLEGVSYEDFNVPPCLSCFEKDGSMNIVHKPDLVFFGESISPKVRDRSFEFINSADRLFIVGTTLATFSAFRLLKLAIEQGKPVLMLTLGPTRADGLSGLEKIDLPSGLVLRDVVRAILGSRAEEDEVVARLLRSGVVKPPEDDEGNPADIVNTTD